MGNILEFQSARLQLHVAMLRHLGVPDIYSWQVIGRPRDRHWDGELYAAPLLVAVRRNGNVCVVDCASGRTPAALDPPRELGAALDAAIIRLNLERRGITSAAVSSWVVFDDGGRIEIETSLAHLNDLRCRAQRVMRDHQLAATHTHQLAGMPMFLSRL